MPAGSEVPGLPRTYRPFGARIAGLVASGALLVVSGFAWFGFDAATRASFTVFQLLTITALVALVASVMYALVRSRVVAESDRLVVVNGYRRHDYAWEQVLAVHLPPGAPWVTLDLSDGRSVSVMGIQGSDGERARRAVRELRAIVAG